MLLPMAPQPSTAIFLAILQISLFRTPQRNEPKGNSKQLQQLNARDANPQRKTEMSVRCASEFSRSVQLRDAIVVSPLVLRVLCVEAFDSTSRCLTGRCVSPTVH